MGCFRCRSTACCCFDSRTGSVFVGIFNLVSGTAGIVTLYFILTGLTAQMNQVEKTPRLSSKLDQKLEQKLDDLAEHYWILLLSYAFPTVVSFLLGISVILSCVKNSEYFLLISVFLEGILILAVLTIGVILFFLSLTWTFFLPHFVWGVVQFYFTLVLLTYRSDIVHYKKDELDDVDTYSDS